MALEVVGRVVTTTPPLGVDSPLVLAEDLLALAIKATEAVEVMMMEASVIRLTKGKRRKRKRRTGRDPTLVGAMEEVVMAMEEILTRHLRPRLGKVRRKEG